MSDAIPPEETTPLLAQLAHEIAVFARTETHLKRMTAFQCDTLNRWAKSLAMRDLNDLEASARIHELETEIQQLRSGTHPQVHASHPVTGGMELQSATPPLSQVWRDRAEAKTVDGWPLYTGEVQAVWRRCAEELEQAQSVTGGREP